MARLIKRLTHRLPAILLQRILLGWHTSDRCFPRLITATLLAKRQLNMFKVPREKAVAYPWFLFRILCRNGTLPILPQHLHILPLLVSTWFMLFLLVPGVILQPTLQPTDTVRVTLPARLFPKRMRQLTMGKPRRRKWTIVLPRLLTCGTALVLPIVLPPKWATPRP